MLHRKNKDKFFDYIDKSGDIIKMIDYNPIYHKNLDKS